MTADASHAKRALRAEIRERRHTLTSTQREHAERGLTDNLIALTTRLGARSVACYLSGPHEPTTRPFLEWATRTGVRVVLPVTREDGLLDWAVWGGQEYEGLFGVPEPQGELLSPLAVNDVDLILVPAAAVDSSGMRMGWGRGYFDKTLGSMERCPPVYAVLFDDEIVDEVPRERHDQPVGGAVTPSRILSF